MSPENAKKIVEYIQNQGLISDMYEIKVIEEYSGRGMYENHTAAIVVPYRSLWGIIGWVIATLGIDRSEIPQSIDNFGYDYVIY